MSIHEHHRKQLETIERKFGLSILHEILYRISCFDNSMKICRDYGIELYQLRYLMQVSNEANRYCYEREHRVELKLILSNVA